MKKIYKTFYFLIILGLFILCSCEPKNSRILTDYPNSTWKSNDDFICKLEIFISSSSEMTSIVTYQDQSINFSNYIISERIYFISLDNTKKFTIKHNYVQRDSLLLCSISSFEISSIFNIIIDDDEIEFELIKCN